MKALEGKTHEAFTDADWEGYLCRWRQGTHRAGFFRDMVLADVQRLGPQPTLLDIGCGHSFDGEPELQASLAALAGRSIGIEPDSTIQVSDCFSQVYRCALEEAPLAAQSIDVAFAVFVIEHLPRPQAFFDRLSEILVPGGVFWGFTIDLRHLFALVSLATEALGVKGWCLKRVGATEAARGANHYRTYYRANTPRAVERCAARFRSIRMMNLHQTGQLDAYLPRWVRPVSRRLDQLTSALGLPGPMLVVRLEKQGLRE